ncbi:MAG TPA: ABC transporter permease [Burkholderiaceae bacterium]
MFKLGQAVITLWATVTLLFIAQVVLPGDRATIYLNVYEGQSVERTPQELAPINKEFGFDRPLLVQYASYMGGVLHGDLGIALQTHRKVTELIGEQIGATAQLAAVALVLAWFMTVAWVVTTAGRSVLVSRFGAAVEALFAGMPRYWLGLILLLVFAVRLDWFPVVGGTSWRGIWLPALTLALPLAGFLGQAIRTEYERALRQPHVLSSRARGTDEFRVRVVHALRPALIPGITLSGWALGTLVSGAVIVENVFSRPGIGALLVNAVQLKEFELISGVILIVSLLYVAVTFITDGLYAVVDPRVRLSHETKH